MQYKTMIAGISGTHGTGKTTIMNALMLAQQSVDRSQISRTAQSNLGWSTLKDATKTVESTIEFQEAILMAMQERDKKIMDAGINTTVFVERTPADVYAYAKWWMTNLHKCRMTHVMLWLNDFRNRCATWHDNYLTTIVVRPHHQIPFVEDPNRASLDNREFVKVEIESLVADRQHHIITSLLSEERAAECVMAVTAAKQLKGIK